MAKRSETPDEDSPEYIAARKTLGVRVKEARLKARLTQAELASRANTTQSYIFEMESGGSNVTLKTLTKLAEVLQLSARDLLPESPTAPLTTASLERLYGLLERAAAMLAERQSQEAALLAELHDLAELRFSIEQVIKVSQSESPAPSPSREGGGGPKRRKAPH